MSMVTMTYADEITKENQQDQEISNDQNNTKDGENSNTNDGKETENDLIQGNDSDCQTAHCGRGKSHFIFGGLASPIVPYRNLTQTTDGITADCRSLV